MRRTILILISILILVYVALSVLGRGGEYAAEKLLYRAVRINEKIAVNPDVAPPAMVTAVEKSLGQIIKDYPATDAAKTARMALADFYASRKKYDKAFSVIDSIIEANGKDETVLSKAYYLRGAIYEKQGKWNEALREYETVRDKYTYTQLGIQIPLYIGKYYADKEDKASADKAYNEAAAFYDRVEKDNKGKVIGYTAATLKKEAYLRLEDYADAGKAIEYIFDVYPSEMTYARELPYVEFVFSGKLKRPEEALKIYKKVKSVTKNQKLSKLLDQKIGELEGKKQ